MMKKNDVFVGTCHDLTNEALGVVRVDGFCYFVKDLLPGEEAQIKVTAVKKNYGFGIVQQLLKVSEDRIEPACGVFKCCGGCQLQHLSYLRQLEYKKRLVQMNFVRIGGMDVQVEPCLGMSHPYQYRNKVQVPVAGKGNDVKIGFFRRASNEIVEYENCPVQSDLQNQIVFTLKEWISEKGCASLFRHILIKHAHCTNEVMVVFIVRSYEDVLQQLAIQCKQEFEQVKGVIANINIRTDNVVLGEQEICLWGKEQIIEELEGLKFAISSKSFYQINPEQTHVLYRKVIEFAQLTTEENVLDLYCGTGTIGLFAAKYAQHVTGIEIVPEAIDDAKKNAEVNGISNIDFICSDAGSYARILADRGELIDVILVDPPRKGLDNLTIDSMTMMKPKRIVYISCDSSTLARDCAKLKQHGYQVVKVQPVDMFPQTTHTEVIILLQKQK